MEYLQVFDKERNLLNEKIERDNKYNLPEGKYFMVSLIFVENDEGKFLFQKTSAQKNSCIATTGGHVTYKDNGLYTAIKEVEEELGIKLNEDELKYIDTFEYKNCLTDIYYLKKNIDINSLVLQEEEVESVNWYTVDEINKFIEEGIFRESNIKPFRRILELKK